MEPIRVLPDDSLGITLFASTTDEIVIHLRMSEDKEGLLLRPRSVRVPISHASGDRSLQQTEVGIPTGWIQSGVVQDDLVLMEPGRVSIQVSLFAFGRRHTLLAQGQVYALHEIPFGVFEDPLAASSLKVDNEADSTLVNNVTLTRDITVPANTRWRLRYGSVLNADNVDRAIDYIWDDGTDPLGGWNSPDTRVTIVAGQRASFPMDVGTTFQTGNPHEIILSEGDRIRIFWFAGGASAGGTAKSSAVVEEWIGV